ncbi:MAG: class I SAM-dependent methyltransferase [Sulfurovum sp.]|nr:class I SAM-dependent methyltransferase [Sulfurovum sp.]MDD3602756.1 class I SAM-dependent methyltransferase [Sulfurovum sp.]
MAKTKSFEQYAENYEIWFEKHKTIYDDEVQTAKKLIGPVSNGFEIGIGSGKFALPLGIKIGIEPSKRMRELAQAKGLEVIDGVAENLPFENEKFNFAVMITTVCFVDDLLQALSEAYRVIVPGGFLLIGMVEKNSPMGKEYQKKKAKSKFYGEASFYSIQEVTALAQKAGFVYDTSLGVESTNNDFVFIKYVKPKTS